MKDFDRLSEFLTDYQNTADVADGCCDSLSIRRALQLQQKSPKYFVADPGNKKAFVSEALRRLFGLESRSVTGIHEHIASLICHDTDRDLFNEALWHLHDLKEVPKKLSYDLYYRIRRPDNTIVWIYQNTNVIPNHCNPAHSLVVGTVTILDAIYLLNNAHNRLTDQRLDEDIVELLRENAADTIACFEIPIFKRAGKAILGRERDLLLMQMSLMLNCQDKSLHSYRLKNQLVCAFHAVNTEPDEIARRINKRFADICTQLRLDPVEVCRREDILSSEVKNELLASILAQIELQSSLDENSLYTHCMTNKELLNIVSTIGNHFSGFKYLVQPIVKASTGEWYAGEILLRSKELKHTISPARFVSMLENSRMIVPFSRHTFDQAIEWAKELREVHPKMRITVNITPTQLIDEYCFEYIKRGLEKAGLSGNCFTFEITEDAPDTHFEKTKKFLAQCKELGIRLAQDDFGEGSSMLMRFFESDFNVVKLSRDMSCKMVADPKCLDFVRAFTDVCHAHGVDVCVEGVEDTEMLEALKDLKPDFYQGYYFSRPIEIDQFLEEAAKRSKGEY